MRIPKQLKFSIYLALLCFLATGSQVKAQNPHYDPTNTDKWEYDASLSDEFNGTTVDKTKWHIQGDNSRSGAWMGRPPAQYIKDAVSIRNNMLYITTKWNPSFNNWAPNYYGEAYGNPAPLTTGCLISKAENDFTHGYMEIRCKAADAPISSSFWTTGPGGEMDLFEHYGRNPNKPYSETKMHTSVHDWRGSSSNQTNNRKWSHDTQLEYRVADDFHVYGIEWDPKYIKYHIDGRLIGYADRDEVDKTDGWSLDVNDKSSGSMPKHRLWLDCEAFPWEYNSGSLKASDFPNDGAHFITDYVRIWHKRPADMVNLTAPVNLITNGTFENGNLNGWTTTGSVGIESGQPTELKGKVAGIARPTHGEVWNGTKAAALTGSGAMEQTVTGLKPNTTYVLSVHAKSPETNEADQWYNAFVGVKNYGNVARDNMIFMPRFYQKGVVFTTGPNATSATIYFTNQGKNAAGNRDAHGRKAVIDDVILFEAPATNSNVGDVGVNSIQLSQTSTEILQRGSDKLNVSFTPSNATDKRIIWSTTDESIVKVSGSGGLTAVGPGVAVIKAISQGNNSATATCTVTVTPNYNVLNNGDFEKGSLVDWWENIGLVSTTDQNVYEGTVAAKVERLASLGQVYTVKPDTEYEISFMVKIANKDASKPVYSIIRHLGWENPVWGEAIVPASTDYFKVTRSYRTSIGEAEYRDTLSIWNSSTGAQIAYVDNFLVKEVSSNPVSVTGVSLPSGTLSLEDGETQTIAATVLPTGATNKTVSWTSSNTAVVTVNANGLVTAVGRGNATITVKTSDGNFTATKQVSVTSGVAVSSVALNTTSLFISPNETATLVATVLPSNASNKSVVWMSQDRAIADVVNGVVTANSAGTVAITVRTVDGLFTKTCTVTVAQSSMDNSGFELGNLNSWNRSYGNSSVVNNNAHAGQYAGYLNGNGAIDRDVTVKSSTKYRLSCWAKVGTGHTAYLGVQDFGGNVVSELITATGYAKYSVEFTTGSNNTTARIWVWNGDATHRIYCDDFLIEEVSGSISPISVTGVDFSEIQATLAIGNTLQLAANVAPNNASNKSITWSSSNTNVASVSAGTVTAKANGTATITVRTTDGNFAATCTVVVNTVVVEPTGDIYFIVSKHQGQKITALSGNSLSYTGANSANTDNTKWIQVATSQGYFRLQNVGTGLYLSAPISGSALAQTTATDATTEWTMSAATGGFFYFQNKATGNYFRPQSVNTTLIERPTSVINYSTQWKLVEVSKKVAALANSEFALNASSVHVYPIPAVEFINIKIDGTTKNSKVSMYDLRGRMILSNVYSDSKIQLETKGLQGIYLLKIENIYGTYTEKIVVR